MSKIHRWGMIIAFFTIVLCAFIGIKTIFIEDKNITVTSVIGMEFVDAVDLLQSQGLLAKVDKIDSPQKVDTVVSQSLPPGDKVSKGKVVVLRVSKGGAVMPIPDVRGLKFEDGVRKLGEAGFKVSKIVRVTDKLKPAGSIIAQNPAAPQQVAANCMVSLLVSSGSAESGSFIEVPNLRGEDAEVARQMLEQAGLVPNAVSESPSSSALPGTVLSTAPRAGAKVPVGTQVNITVARAPQAGESAPDSLAAAEPDSGRPEAVRTVVVKDPEPSQAPPKAQDSAAVKPQEIKKEPAKQASPSVSEPVSTQNADKKTAKVRYQVPPLAKPLSLKIELTDSSGTRVLKDATVNGGEYISINAPYSGEATIMIYLGGDFVWQDRFK